MQLFFHPIWLDLPTLVLNFSDDDQCPQTTDAVNGHNDNAPDTRQAHSIGHRWHVSHSGLTTDGVSVGATLVCVSVMSSNI